MMSTRRSRLNSPILWCTIRQFTPLCTKFPTPCPISIPRRLALQCRHVSRFICLWCVSRSLGRFLFSWPTFSLWIAYCGVYARHFVGSGTARSSIESVRVLCLVENNVPLLFWHSRADCLHGLVAAMDSREQDWSCLRRLLREACL